MIKKFRQLCEKYLNQTATPIEKKVVDDFIQTMQEQAFVPRDQVKRDTQLKQRMYSRIIFKTKIRKRQQKRKQSALLAFAFLGLLASSAWLSANLFFQNESYFAVALGEKVQYIQLDDATTVALTPGSKLTVSKNFNAVDRQVTLEGEAFFNVARNEAKPFLVQTDQVAVSVLGTSFLVNDTQVVVKTGKVVVEKHGGTTHNNPDKVGLTAHEKVTFMNGDFIKSSVDILSLHAGNREALVMYEMPLQPWKKLMEEEFNIQIQMEGLPQVNLYTTGDFRNTSLQDIVHSFCFIHQAKYRVSGSILYIEK